MEDTSTQYKYKMVKPFDPSNCGGDTRKEFEKFVRLFECKYWALDRKAPTGTEDQTAWVDLDMWKQLMGNYVTDRFLDDIMSVSAEPRKQTFSEMVKLLRDRYAPTENTTLAYYNFHRLRQAPGQSFDDYCNEVKRAEKYCEFKCSSKTCTVSEVLIRDQIILGIHDEEFQKEALQKGYNREDTEKQGRRAEAAKKGITSIKEGPPEATVEHVKPGNYSTKV